jgi:putative membrane protein insertion efficiency factor
MNRGPEVHRPQEAVPADAIEDRRIEERSIAMKRLLAFPLLGLLWIYRRLVSPVLPQACRYYPSCSQYAEEAVRVHGPLLGPWLALRRLLRCHPFAEGGPDPVPPRGLKASRAG